MNANTYKFCEGIWNPTNTHKNKQKQTNPYEQRIAIFFASVVFWIDEHPPLPARNRGDEKASDAHVDARVGTAATNANAESTPKAFPRTWNK